MSQAPPPVRTFKYKLLRFPCATLVVVVVAASYNISEINKKDINIAKLHLNIEFSLDVLKSL